MTAAATPILQVRHSEGRDWCVAATWPDGRFEEIGGFKSESEANAWVADQFQAWLDERNLAERDGGVADSIPGPRGS